MNWPADNLERWPIEKLTPYAIVKRWQDFTGQQAIHEATGKTFAEMAERIAEAA